jgi:hypothetical protein
MIPLFFSVKQSVPDALIWDAKFWSIVYKEGNPSFAVAELLLLSSGPRWPVTLSRQVIIPCSTPQPSGEILSVVF